MLGDCSHLFAWSDFLHFQLSTCIAANVVTYQGTCTLKISADLRPASRKELTLDFKAPAGVTQGGIGYTKERKELSRVKSEQDGFTETHQQKDKIWSVNSVTVVFTPFRTTIAYCCLQ